MRDTSVSPAEFTETAFGRVRRAIEAYRELGEGWGDAPPSAARVADVALDAGIAAEAALKGIVDHLGIPRPVTREAKLLLDLLDILTRRPELPEAIKAAHDTYRDALETVRRARNRAVHGGVPLEAPDVALRAVRDTIRLVLLLAVTYPVLGQRWALPYSGVVEELWSFDGQPEFFATQVHEAFSNKCFENLRVDVHVSRFTGGSAFRLTGPFSVGSEIEQSRWFNPNAGSIMKMLPAVQAEIGMVPPPEMGDPRTPEGTTTSEGVITLLARNIDARVDGFPNENNPLLAPIRLTPEQDGSWMVGPGDLRLISLRVELPYRARVNWFATADSRVEVVSAFVETSNRGAVEGMLAFRYPGHGAKPAFRGTAAIQGTSDACAKGKQIAEWRVFRDPDGVISGWKWEDVTHLRLRSTLTISLNFGKVEIFR